MLPACRLLCGLLHRHLVSTSLARLWRRCSYPHFRAVGRSVETLVSGKLRAEPSALTTQNLLSAILLKQTKWSWRIPHHGLHDYSLSSRSHLPPLCPNDRYLLSVPQNRQVLPCLKAFTQAVPSGRSARCPHAPYPNPHTLWAHMFDRGWHKKFSRA